MTDATSNNFVSNWWLPVYILVAIFEAEMYRIGHSEEYALFFSDGSETIRRAKVSDY
jgi:hypothetical protein